VFAAIELPGFINGIDAPRNPAVQGFNLLDCASLVQPAELRFARPGCEVLIFDAF
jgi:hypothetical protein